MINRKVKSVLFGLFLASLLCAGLGCSDDEECQSSSSACGSFTACCSSKDCYYLASDGTRFDCDGTNCNAAAERMANYMCKKLQTESPEEFDRVVEEILEAAHGRDKVLWH